MKDLINDKYGIEITKITELDSGIIIFAIKESKRSKKLKQGSSLAGFQGVREYFEKLIRYEKEREQKLKDKRDQEKKLKKDFLSALKPGVILFDSWGYDQTNVEFYKVIKVNGSEVLLLELGHKVEKELSDMSQMVVPGEALDKDIVKKIVRSDRIKITSYILLTLWDGKPKYSSSYA